MVVITIAIGALASFTAARNVDGSGRYFDPTNRSLDGLYLSQLLVILLPQSWQNDGNRWVLTYAGGEIFATKPDPTDPALSHLFSAWTGFGVFAMYAAIALTSRRRSPGRHRSRSRWALGW
jgi:hypothetical protein